MTVATHISDVDAVVDGPHGLKVVLHAGFERLGEVVEAEELLEVLGLGVECGSPGVHPLDEGRHVTEHHRMHHG